MTPERPFALRVAAPQGPFALSVAAPEAPRSRRARSRRALPILAAAALAAACATPQKDLSRMAAARPRSILVVPVVNRSVNVTAPDYFLSTVPLPLADRGYYVFPVNLVKRVLEDDGLADAGLVHGADPTRLAALFGADAVLYIAIERWEAKYVVLNTTVTVELSYVLKDGRTGEPLWSERRRAAYSSDPGNQGGGLGTLVAAAISAAVTKAAPNYIPLARKANTEALAYPGPGFPAGPYRSEHEAEYAAARVAKPATPANAPAARPAAPPPPSASERVPAAKESP